MVAHHMGTMGRVDNGLEERLKSVVSMSRDSHSIGVSLIIGLNLYLVARGQEGVEADNELGVSFEEHAHPADHPRSVNGLRLEFLHDVQKVIIDLGLVPKLELDLVQIGEGIFNLQSLKGGGLIVGWLLSWPPSTGGSNNSHTNSNPLIWGLGHHVSRWALHASDLRSPLLGSKCRIVVLGHFLDNMCLVERHIVHYGPSRPRGHSHSNISTASLWEWRVLHGCRCQGQREGLRLDISSRLGHTWQLMVDHCVWLGSMSWGWSYGGAFSVDDPTMGQHPREGP